MLVEETKDPHCGAVKGALLLLMKSAYLVWSPRLSSVTDQAGPYVGDMLTVWKIRFAFYNLIAHFKCSLCSKIIKKLWTN
jgi:hypothetical protein